jgi:plasmid stabilization system protein ParE
VTARLLVREAAEADLAEAYEWYAARDHHLAEEFLRAFEATGKAARNSPRRFPLLFEHAGVGVRRALMERFPYSVLFVWDEDQNLVSVLGCFHVKRDPEVWRGRL